jgi:hypothetical protein
MMICGFIGHFWTQIWIYSPDTMLKSHCKAGLRFRKVVTDNIRVLLQESDCLSPIMQPGLAFEHDLAYSKETGDVRIPLKFSSRDQTRASTALTQDWSTLAG